MRAGPTASISTTSRGAWRHLRRPSMPGNRFAWNTACGARRPIPLGSRLRFTAARAAVNSPDSSVRAWTSPNARRRKRQQARLAAIVESSDDAIVGKSLDGMITSWNAGAVRSYGYPAEEIVGRPFSVLMPPERVKEVERTIAQLGARRAAGPFRDGAAAQDGRLINVLVSYSPIRDREGRLTGTAMISRDITERKRAEQTGSFLAEVSETLSSLVDLKSTLEKVARLSVPYFADWCCVDLVNADGLLQRLAIANVDPALLKRAHAVYQAGSRTRSIHTEHTRFSRRGSPS